MPPVVAAGKDGSGPALVSSSGPGSGKKKWFLVCFKRLSARGQKEKNCNTGIFKVSKSVFVWTLGSVMFSFTESATDSSCTRYFDSGFGSFFRRLFNFLYLFSIILKNMFFGERKREKKAHFVTDT